ncbi:phosphoesterase [Streptomyces sp. SID5785]|uniref:purple acid phosphatase family protein n=1 Tax=Streptomyces sp. SID5785 TaxID=2690309 RepID=UPI0013615DAF|nr:metallophosphoesterase family protein [Streptomyces sp. SID5785]MZD06807.1 phosphoesterase [Streptomyces sp. SID5785]
MDTPDVGIPETLARRMSMPEQHAYLRARFSRRRALAGAAAVAGGAALLGDGAAAPVFAAHPAGPVRGSVVQVDGALVAPFGRHLAFGADPRTQLRVSWQVPFAVRRPFLRVGPKPWELGPRIEAEVRALHTPALSGKLPEVEQLYLHVALDGLTPGATYSYGVGHDGFDPAAPERLGTLGTFRTAPAAPGPFVFTAFGDQGVGYDALGNDQVILGQNPAFHLHAGDLCYADSTGHGRESDTYDARVWDQFLAQTETVAKSVPWMVTTGNHDMEAWYSPNGYGGQSARWSLPDNGPDPRGAPGVYSFVYGNVAVVALDANDVSYEIPANRGCTDGKQTAWLDRRLGELRARADVEFVVVFFHHCAYSTSTHASDGGVRDSWVPLFDQHRVDLVINGHNHVYERTDALRGGEVGRPVPVGASTDPARDGIVYVTAGGAGKDLYGFGPGVPDSHEGRVRDREAVTTFRWTRSREAHPETVTWSRVRYTGHSFLAVEVTKGRMTVSALASDGRRVDRFDVRRGSS